MNTWFIRSMVLIISRFVSFGSYSKSASVSFTTCIYVYILFNTATWHATHHFHEWKRDRRVHTHPHWVYDHKRAIVSVVMDLTKLNLTSINDRIVTNTALKHKHIHIRNWNFGDYSNIFCD